MELTDLYPNIYKQLKLERARENYLKYGLYTDTEYNKRVKEIKTEKDFEFYEEDKWESVKQLQSVKGVI